MKRCAAPCVIRKIAIRITTRQYHTPAGMTGILTDAGKWKSPTFVEEMPSDTVTLEDRVFAYKVSISLPYNPTPGIYPREIKVYIYPKSPA